MYNPRDDILLEMIITDRNGKKVPIKELLERVEELEHHSSKMETAAITSLATSKRRGEKIKTLRTRVEELEDEAIHNEGVMVALKEGYTEAKARVEELEENKQ